MTTEQIFSVINDLSSLGTRIIGFDGGEPLLRQDLGRILEYAKGKGLTISLNTNGSLVPGRVSEIKYADSVDISLDGPAQVHDHLREKNSYRDIMEAAEVLKKNNIPLRFHYTLSKYNIQYVDFILEKAEELDIKISFGPLHSVHFWQEGEALESLYPEAKDYKKTLEKLISYKRKHKYIANSASSLRFIQNWPSVNQRIKCFAGKFFCRLEPNGDMYPCTMLRHRLKPVNCVTYGVREAFNRTLKVNCGGCWCMGTLELNYLLSLDVNTILNNMCQLFAGGL